MNRPTRAHLRIFALAVALVASWPAIAGDVESPDGRIRFSLEIGYLGVPQYSISFDDETVVDTSKLGLRFKARAGFDRDVEIRAVERNEHDETWEQPWGERRTVRDHHNEALFVFAAISDPGRVFRLRVRVFNDGVGFRYEVPAQEHYDSVEIVDEMTEFHVPSGARAWWIPGRAWNRHEFLYRETGLHEIALANTPATMKLASGPYLSIHEAALVDYAGYVLDQRRDGVFRTNLTPWSDGARVKTVVPFVTPWRTIQISPDAVGLLNSSLILNLNEPNALGDVSWVEPGKYAGIWWAMHIEERTWGSGPRHGATTAETKRYIDFAAEHGFDGVLVEGWNIGWDGEWFNNGSAFRFAEPHPDFDFTAITEYAKKQSVRLVGHHETSGHITNYENQLQEALDLYESAGVCQVKTGYVADGGDLVRIDANGVPQYEWHDGQFAARHYLHVVREAAKRKISINTHEPIKDTGLRRTYPNWISREGARGQEFNAWGTPPNPPEHTAMLPFTRLLAGPMDFTPGIFDLMFDGPDSPQRVSTTLMKQLALYVVLYSPVQMVADLPENYERFPDAFQFIVDVPTDWEQSMALAGEIGDFVVYARQQRGADDWYLGALTDENARELQVAMTFLPDGVGYVATIYRDGDNAHWQDNPYDYVIEERTVTNKDTLELRLAAGGGAAIRFRPAEKAEQE
jgi:alpha-glucosidase